METAILIPMLALLQGLYWLIGRRSFKGLRDVGDYFLAGRKVSFFPLMMTFLATQVGGGVILGAADEAYQMGWVVLFYPMGAVLGLIILGLGIGSRLSKFSLSTVAELFEVVYGSVFLRKVASLLSIFSLFMILVAQILASYKFLSSMGLGSPLLLVAFWAVVVFYTAKGGLKAVISTDVIQGLFFSIVFLGLGGFLFYKSPVTPVEINGFSTVSPKICSWILMPLLFMLIEQDMGQRCFAGANPKVVSRAALSAALGTLVVCIVPVFLGSLARSIGLEVAPGRSVLMSVVMKMTSPWVSALVGSAVLAAIISTATSLINAISSNLSNDFSSFKKDVRTVRYMTVVISVGAIFSAFYFDSILGLLIQSYELSVSALFVPLVFALFGKKGNFAAALLSILFGSISFFIFHFFSPPVARELISLGASLLGYALGSQLAFRSKQEGG